MEKKKKILIIDDNPFYYSDVIDDLKQEFEIQTVNSLGFASHRLEISHYDLAIIDIMMPTDGFRFQDEYRTGLDFYYSHIRPKYPDMKIIFWSALSDLAIKDYFENKGGIPTNVYMVPKHTFKNEEIRRFINTILFPEIN